MIIYPNPQEYYKLNELFPKQNPKDFYSIKTKTFWSQFLDHECPGPSWHWPVSQLQIQIGWNQTKISVQTARVKVTQGFRKNQFLVLKSRRVTGERRPNKALRIPRMSDAKVTRGNWPTGSIFQSSLCVLKSSLYQDWLDINFKLNINIKYKKESVVIKLVWISEC